MNKLFLLLFSLFVLIQTVVAQNPFITNYTYADGLSSNRVYCVYQDRNDFMWFGTKAGVFRFDGNNFVLYTNKDGLSETSVIRMKEDLEGRLWFFNFDGSLNYFFENKICNEENTSFLKELRTNFYFIDFFQDKDSTLYFYNPVSEIFVVKDNELIDYNHFTYDKSKYNVNLSYLSKTSENKFILWSAAGVFQTESIDDTLQQIPQETLPLRVFKKSNTESVEIDQMGYISMFRGTKVIRRNILRIDSRLINSMVIDNNNNLWISAFDEGVYCYKDDSLLLHLPIKYPQNLILDNENNLWVASNSDGIYKINLNILKYKFIGNDKFDGIGITDIASSNQDGVWATNGEALFYILDYKKFPPKISTGGKIINNIHQLKNNSIILSGTGINMTIVKNVVVDAEKKKIKFESSKKLGFRIKNFAIDSTESFIYSPVNDQILIVNLEVLTESKIFKFKRGRIKKVFFNKENKLIVNASKNYMFTDSIGLAVQYQRFNEKLIRSNLVIDKENEVFNVDGKDIFLLNGSNYHNLTDVFKSQIDNLIKDMVYDGSNLFFFTDKTVYFIPDPLKIIQNKPLQLNRLNIEFNGIKDLFCKDSTLYVGSNDGITFIPIKECVNSQVQPTKPYFYKVSLDDDEYDFNSKTVEFKDNKKLSIEFSSLNYSSIPSNYAYKLSGVDENWISGKETRVVYLNLAPGNYTFKLKSRKNREQYSEVIELPIVVHPTFFQRLTTKVLVGLLLLLLVFLIIRMFYKRKIKQKETDHLLTTLEHKALQSMMNPHFIFNALGSIQGFLLRNKPVEAGTYLSQFARLIRQNMNSLKSNFICVDDEIERLRNYIELEKLRMNNKFNYQIEVDDQLDSYEVYIPSMVVQPFVENAIWHGVSELEKDGFIKIVFSNIDDKSIEVIVEDNGFGIKEEETLSKTGHGLNMGVSLTKRRLKLIGDRQGVKSEIVSKDLFPGTSQPGTQVKIIIPIIDNMA